MSKNKMQIIDDLVIGKGLCVLATSDGIEPHACLMNYLLDHAAMKFYFLSSRDSHKSRNLRKNAHVSLLIDSREDHLPDRLDEALALTVQGISMPVHKQQTIDAIIHLFLLKHPHLTEFAAKEDTELIRIQAKSATLLRGIEEKFTTNFKIS